MYFFSGTNSDNSHWTGTILNSPKISQYQKSRVSQETRSTPPPKLSSATTPHLAEAKTTPAPSYHNIPVSIQIRRSIPHSGESKIFVAHRSKPAYSEDRVSISAHASIHACQRKAIPTPPFPLARISTSPNLLFAHRHQLRQALARNPLVSAVSKSGVLMHQ
ncbi:hypothetical protein DL98DRAFT_237484 [Cadophora sp. DSE1049]|nr:hypothetical protein DL98DRAFT_237484 [Cadophora sp. DSE1049]